MKRKIYKGKYEILLYDEDDTLVFIGESPAEVCHWLGRHPKDPDNTINYHHRNKNWKVRDIHNKYYKIEFMEMEKNEK